MADHLLIDGASVVTMNPARQVLEHASVAVAEERIVEVSAANAPRLGVPHHFGRKPHTR